MSKGSQAAQPATPNQRASVRGLLEWRADIRTYRPESASRNALLHEKTILVDRAVYLLGSANFTRNSLENSVEASLVTRVESVVRRAGQHFDGLWGMSTPLTWESQRE